MKFNMGDTTLGDLVKQTDASHADLSALLKRFMTAAEPLEKDMDGAGKRAFDAFKVRADDVGFDLQSSLGLVNQGQSGMDAAFQEGDQEAADNAQQMSSAADYDGARFGTRA